MATISASGSFTDNIEIYGNDAWRFEFAADVSETYLEWDLSEIDYWMSLPPTSEVITATSYDATYAVAVDPAAIQVQLLGSGIDKMFGVATATGAITWTSFSFSYAAGGIDIAWTAAPGGLSYDYDTGIVSGGMASLVIDTPWSTFEASGLLTLSDPDGFASPAASLTGSFSNVTIGIHDPVYGSGSYELSFSGSLSTSTDALGNTVASGLVSSIEVTTPDSSASYSGDLQFSFDSGNGLGGTVSGSIDAISITTVDGSELTLTGSVSLDPNLQLGGTISGVSFTTAGYAYSASNIGRSVLDLLDGDGSARDLNGDGVVNVLDVMAFAGGGNDTIVGGPGNDVLDGGAGSDTLTGGAGSDTFVLSAAASAGVDVVTDFAAGSGGDLLCLAAVVAELANFSAGSDPFASGHLRLHQSGTDTLIEINRLGAAHADDWQTLAVLQNTVAADLGSANIVQGYQPALLLVSGSGNDTLEGGAGYDTVSYATAAAGVTVDLSSTAAQATGGAGSDTLVSIENLIGSAFDDSLAGNSAANLLDGGEGADTLAGGQGADTYHVDDAGDVVSETDNTPTGSQGYQLDIDLGSIIDTVVASIDYALGNYLENLTLTGSEDLAGSGNALDNALTGNDGDNTLSGGAGSDTLDGGAGTDTASYAGAAASVRVSLALAAAQNTGGAGTDTLAGIENLAGSAYNDGLTGNAGDNVLQGGAGNDTLAGGAGNDTLAGGYGADRLTGGSGTDTASYAGAASAVSVSLTLTAAQSTGGAGTDTLAGIESLIGSDHNDSLTGNSAGNLLEGGAGNDTLTGNAGNDTLAGGLGADRLTGGTGNDTASFAEAASAVTVSLAVTTAQNTGGAGTDMLNGLENLVGSAYNDSLTGSSAGNLLHGGAGNDTLAGNAGNDTLAGGLGADRLTGGTGTDTASYAEAAGAVTVSLVPTTAQNTGGAGWDRLAGIESLLGSSLNDRLTGNAAANTLEGGAGNDTLRGGAGADAFVLGHPASSDTLGDFISGSDTIRIRMPAIRIGDGDAALENAATVSGQGGFAATAELVIVTANISGTIDAASAAAAIGSATAAYASGEKRLFAVDNGSSSALFLFTSAGADAAISAAELTQLASLTNTAATATGDYVFVT